MMKRTGGMLIAGYSVKYFILLQRNHIVIIFQKDQAKKAKTLVGRIEII